jgi:Trk K+ transport system NAD-binding subunit
MRITLLGAGHIGQTIARLLATSGDYDVTVFDRDDSRAGAAGPGIAVRRRAGDTADPAALLQACAARTR